MAESNQVSPLALDSAICRMLKYSNNTEMHGEEFARGWKVPFENVMLSAEQLRTLYGDPHVDRAWFNDRKGLKEPMPWVMKNSQSFPDKFDQAAVGIEITGARVLEFEDCIVQIDELIPQTGGLTKTKLSIYLHPDDKQMLQIDLHQHREVKLSIADAAVMLKKKSGQKDLPLEGGGEKAAAEDTAHPDPDAQNGATPPGYDKRSTITNGSGETTELRSGKEIDDEMNARAAEKGEKGAKDADAKFGDDIGPKTRAEIEAVKTRRGRQPINGRGKGAH
jgi:hypothetical protein